MKNGEILAFIIYFIAMMGIGVFFFIKSKGKGDKDFFLGGRTISPLVAALSTGASDMSSWVLMGLPGSILLLGMGQVWIAIGLAIGTILSWVLIAKRLRNFSIVANDSITLPQYLTNRFKSKSLALQIVCAIVFIFVYTIYAASSIKACGILFNTVFGMDQKVAMLVAAAITIVYTFLGGFSADCWSDVVQGLIMLAALLVTPIIALFALKNPEVSGSLVKTELPDHYWSFLSSGNFDWKSISDIISGLGWGIGYFAVPHIIVRYMSVKSSKEVKKSAIIGSSWTCLILISAVGVGLVGRVLLPELNAETSELVFIKMVRFLFSDFTSGILLSAILAASMSSADSQLLVSASALVSDVYKPVFRKNASEKELSWLSRGVVLVIAIAATVIAFNPASGSIMNLVENAWGVFGAAFGPVIILSLFWKRFTYGGAVAGIIAGAVSDVLWLAFIKSYTGIYEIVPGFIVGMAVAIAVTLAGKKPSAEIEKLFDDAVSFDG